MDFLLFRVSLKRKQNLFAEIVAASPREQWLRRVFSRERLFTHFNSDFVFKPEPGLDSTDLIAGWIARERRMMERTSPAEGLVPAEHQFWQAAFLIIDPAEHPDGQKIAMEASQQVGKPEAVLSSLLKSAETTLTRRSACKFSR